jgi:hypothetical protein
LAYPLQNLPQPLSFLKYTIMKKLIFLSAVLATLTSFVVPNHFYASEKTDKVKLHLKIGKPLSAELSGAQETGIGDPDGSGWVELTLNQGQGTIEYTLSVENIATATAAHIHIAPAGVAGPVVVGLSAPSSGSSSGEVTVDAEIIKAIRQHPENYYVNVHNAVYPAGAIRGQLSK